MKLYDVSGGQPWASTAANTTILHLLQKLEQQDKKDKQSLLKFIKVSILIVLVLFVLYHKIKSSQLNQNCSFCSPRRLKANYSSQKALNERGVLFYFFFPVGAYIVTLGHNSLPNCHYKSIGETGYEN